ncbi:MAG: ribosome small subunit-dependent GTPase A [Clostridia bacterium]|nr:ribosome small subunit-dependent GTPase A [Clostridia bacterium]
MMINNETGIIIKGVGGRYTVSASGNMLNCSLDGKLRIGKVIPVPGDRVEVLKSHGSWHISKVLERKNVLIRPAVANIDQLFVVASNSPPKTDTYLIDKMSVIASIKNIDMILLLNKSDLDRSDDLYKIYSRAGFNVIRVSAVTGEGIDDIKSLLCGKISAFTGNSGIGKSSILNLIDPAFKITVGDISRKIERGKHTTRHVEFLPIGDNSYVADTPGFSSFEITQMDKLDKFELQDHFPELREMTGNCRFSDCVHINEPDCPVKEYMEQDSCRLSRYLSYKKIYQELSEVSEY